MADRYIDDWVLTRRQDAADLLHPRPPLIRPPRIVGPEKPAFQQELAKLRDFLRPEIRRPDVLHEEHGAVEQQRIAERNHDVVRLPIRIELDRHPREFRQPY